MQARSLLTDQFEETPDQFDCQFIDWLMREHTLLLFIH